MANGAIARNDAQDWPADHVERRPLNSLIPSARNARVHTEKQVGQIAASIREWGWTMAVLVDEQDNIIAGHGRVLGAARLGIDQIPVIVARGWSEAQKRAYMLADNKLSDNATWDQDLLKIEVADLKTMGFDLPLAGFSDTEIKKLLVGKDQDSSPKMTGLRYSIVVRCDSEQQQTQLLANFEQQGLKCEALIS